MPAGTSNSCAGEGGGERLGRVAVIGATGLIGSAVMATLASRGVETLGVARNVDAGRRRSPTSQWHGMDIGKCRAGDWSVLLRDVAAVVNCAGALQDGPDDDLTGTHETGLATLVAGCEAAGVRRFIHFSAMGVDRATPSAFSRTKLAGEQALSDSDLTWVILRPSVVLGPAAYGASALIRGIAAWPVMPVMPDTAELRPVALEDVVATVEFFLRVDGPRRVAVELSGPDSFSFADLVRLYRSWLGAPPARAFQVPHWAANFAYRAGDAAGRLGWRPPVRSTARREIARGAAADNDEWIRLTGSAPRSIPSLLSSRPASVQDRWFAGLYLLKPIVLASLCLFWIGSGLASLGPGYAAGQRMMADAGVSDALGRLVIMGGGILDLVIGLGLAIRRTARPALLAGIATSLAYAVAGTLLTPWLWLDPLAPLLKIAPMIALMLVSLAILRDR